LNLIKRKDETILKLKHDLKQHINDLNQANEILSLSENRIDSLQNELNNVQDSNRHLLNLMDEEARKYQDLIDDNQMELNEKDHLIAKLKGELKAIRQGSLQNEQNSDLVNYYEQELNEKDELIAVNTPNRKH
jgi:hypothetical protein